MTRTMYESEKDLNNEKIITEELSDIWDCSFEKLPIRYHLDYLITKRDKTSAFCEIKTRAYSMQKIEELGGYLLSLGKWCSAKNLCEASGVPFILIVKTLDGIWWASFNKFPAREVHVLGRKDRDDWQDMEPCILISTKSFKQLEIKNDRA